MNSVQVDISLILEQGRFNRPQWDSLSLTNEGVEQYSYQYKDIYKILKCIMMNNQSVLYFIKWSYWRNVKFIDTHPTVLKKNVNAKINRQNTKIVKKA